MHILHFNISPIVSYHPLHTSFPVPHPNNPFTFKPSAPGPIPHVIFVFGTMAYVLSRMISSSSHFPTENAIPFFLVMTPWCTQATFPLSMNLLVTPRLNMSHNRHSLANISLVNWLWLFGIDAQQWYNWIIVFFRNFHIDSQIWLYLPQ